MAKTTRKTKERSQEYPEAAEELVRFRRIRGQIEGIERMIEDRRPCLETIIQIRSVLAAIRSTESLLIEKQIRQSIQSAIETRDPQNNREKVDELMVLVNKR